MLREEVADHSKDLEDGDATFAKTIAVEKAFGVAAGYQRYLLHPMTDFGRRHYSRELSISQYS